MELRKVFGLAAIVGLATSLMISFTSPDFPKDETPGGKEPLSTTQKAGKVAGLIGFGSMIGMYLSPRKENESDQSGPNPE